MGRVSGDVTVAGRTFNQSARGFGDPMLEFKLNFVGPPAQKSIPDAMRYEPKFSMNLLADLALPVGEYDSKQPLNLGQNRWYGRIGFPIVWQLGSWVPGRRTTLEFLPAVWIFGNNSDYVGQTLKTDPMFQLDAHLTRDFTEHLWGSLDAAWYNGGKATINGVAGEKINNLGVGLTLGYQINDNVALTFGYKSTVNDKAPTDLKMDGFMVSLVFGWHPIVEGSKRLEGRQVRRFCRGRAAGAHGLRYRELKLPLSQRERPLSHCLMVVKSALPFGALDSELLHSRPKGVGVPAEDLGSVAGAVDLPPGLVQHRAYVVSLEVLHAARLGGGLHFASGLPEGLLELQCLPRREDEAPLDDVFQLPHIAWPAVRGKCFHGSSGDALHMAS